MVKPLGGRGQKAPYETVMVRVPLPIKSEVEKVIADYRNKLLSQEGDTENTELDRQELTEYLIASKLVNRFVEEEGITNKLDTKRYVRNTSLVKLRNWLTAHSKK